jgi:hypothetical protein
MQKELLVYPPFMEPYFALVSESSLGEALANSEKEWENLLASISNDRFDVAYAEGKWTLREMVQHVNDTERIFGYRALALARGEKQPLPGFDENKYALTGKRDVLSWELLLEEFSALRTANRLLFKSLSNEALLQLGTANGGPIHTMAIGVALAGHVRHHARIVLDRYLTA